MTTDDDRPLTYHTVARLLQDGQWHSDSELSRISQYPQEWLRELERDGHTLERQGEPPVMFRMVA